MKKFYSVIGNPPYQGECDSNRRKPPIYNYFMDQTYQVSNKVELITPSRFLFDAGQTPKAWNRKMLNDEHLKVAHFEADGSKVFHGTQIKGGVAVTLRDTTKSYGAIETFTVYDELNSIIKKVVRTVDGDKSSSGYLDLVVSPCGNYRTTDLFSRDFPQAKDKLGKGTRNRISSNFFELIPECSSEQPSSDCYKFLCRINNQRTYRYIKKKYIISNSFADVFNLAFSKSNGNGTFGEALTMPEILETGECATDTFISIGQASTRHEADNMLKYIRTQFLRTMLGVKKVTQNNSRSVWKYVPLQDFTSNSDIDWSQSVADIDRQLYAKYGLDDNEIEFIESHVKEMN